MSTSSHTNHAFQCTSVFDTRSEEPGLEPAPQTAQAVEVDTALVDWFRRQLSATI